MYASRKLLQSKFVTACSHEGSLHPRQLIPRPLPEGHYKHRRRIISVTFTRSRHQSSVFAPQAQVIPDPLTESKVTAVVHLVPARRLWGGCRLRC